MSIGINAAICTGSILCVSHFCKNVIEAYFYASHVFFSMLKWDITEIHSEKEIASCFFTLMVSK